MCDENKIEKGCNCGECNNDGDTHVCGDDCTCGEHNHGGIELSPKYGMNPTIPVCFYCNKEKNEIVALGKLPGDTEAPKRCVMDYEPCEDCQEKFSKGRLLVGASETPLAPNQMPIAMNQGKELFPTGNWIVMSKDANLSDDPEFMEKDVVVVDDEVVLHLIEFSKDSEEEAGAVKEIEE